LDAICDAARARNDQWDCIIPYSGGKDSAWQALFVVRTLKLRPLLVRYKAERLAGERFGDWVARVFWPEQPTETAVAA
jgi:hypothetical protein